MTYNINRPKASKSTQFYHFLSNF